MTDLTIKDLFETTWCRYSDTVLGTYKGKTIRRNGFRPIMLGFNHLSCNVSEKWIKAYSVGVWATSPPRESRDLEAKEHKFSGTLLIYDVEGDCVAILVSDPSKMRIGSVYSYRYKNFETKYEGRLFTISEDGNYCFTGTSGRFLSIDASHKAEDISEIEEIPNK